VCERFLRKQRRATRTLWKAEALMRGIENTIWIIPLGLIVGGYWSIRFALSELFSV
jgi:hypothetical protein